MTLFADSLGSGTYREKRGKAIRGGIGKALVSGEGLVRRAA